jgi:hypothetical protein
VGVILSSGSMHGAALPPPALAPSPSASPRNPSLPIAKALKPKLPHPEASSSTNPHPALAPPPSAAPRSPILPISDAPKPKPPRPAAFEKVGGPISEPEFDYVVYMVMEARKAGLQDDLNDFEEDEERPIEIYRAWTELGCPTSFNSFRTAQKGKGRAVSPVLPQPDTPAVNMLSTSGDQLTEALSSKFGLPEAAIQAFSSKAIASAQRSSDLPRNAPRGQKYKLLKGVAKEEASELIDEALSNLLRLSQKHGTDPTAAMKLFRKKLDYFSSSLWDMWEMHQAVKRVTKGSDTDGSGEEEEEDNEEEEEEDAPPSNGSYKGVPEMPNGSPSPCLYSCSFMSYSVYRGFPE